ncbi:MAG: orotate phosphoribosyltransferase [Clostridium sp.]|nr:orotate phosphoribosyltransferase [Clostridium sp.]
MNNKNKELLSWLFETNAVRLCPQNAPFWYTSGKIGPYYINTHFLYGSEEKANKLLEFINKEKENKIQCPGNILAQTWENYESNDIYRGLIDKMYDLIKRNIDIDDITYISGGERRDWFFSFTIAKLLDKPHIAIYKDMDFVITNNGKSGTKRDLNGGNVLHVADLITEASSYQRAWIPAIKNNGGSMKWSLVVIDRKQGGGELLNSNGIESFSMVNIDTAFFRNIFQLGMINKAQYNMVQQYISEPEKSMESFLKKNPKFLHDSLQSEGKDKKRAELCLNKGFYGLDTNSIG